jgi:hypothetical protein
MLRCRFIFVAAATACAANTPRSDAPTSPAPTPQPTTAPPALPVEPPSRTDLVQSDEVMGGRRSFVTVEGCTIGITVYDEANISRESASLDRDCELDGAQAAFGAIVDHIAGDRGAALPFRTLSFGRTGATSFPRLGLRLAALIFASPRWDPKRGAPRGAIGPHQLLQETITAEALVPEVEAAFRERGHCLTAPSVEQIDVRRVADLPSPEALTSLGASPSDRVPFDASLWFKVGELDEGVCRLSPEAS